MEERPDWRSLPLSNVEQSDPNVNYRVDIQWAVDPEGFPHESQMTDWIRRTLESTDRTAPVEVTVRVVDEEEMTGLNEQYRKKHGPTNVLSFPVGIEDEEQRTLLGDIVLCADVVREEAERQGKSLEAHVAHMLVHGVLHLEGYDHLESGEAREMEKLEICLMAQLGFSDPYEGDAS
ncbi:MAG: rRNA maturation RNase YbeY [Pseudomonadales bacterium]|nr:rRNA maturation RNase YbeY [Pseudomonadales bacterium]